MYDFPNQSFLYRSLNLSKQPIPLCSLHRIPIVLVPRYVPPPPPHYSAPGPNEVQFPASSISNPRPHAHTARNDLSHARHIARFWTTEEDGHIRHLARLCHWPHWRHPLDVSPRARSLIQHASDHGRIHP